MSDLVSKNKLRDFAEKINGIRPTERSLRGIVDNLIKNYKPTPPEPQDDPITGQQFKDYIDSLSNAYFIPSQFIEFLKNKNVIDGTGVLGDKNIGLAGCLNLEYDEQHSSYEGSYFGRSISAYPNSWFGLYTQLDKFTSIIKENIVWEKLDENLALTLKIGGVDYYIDKISLKDVESFVFNIQTVDAESYIKSLTTPVFLTNKFKDFLISRNVDMSKKMLLNYISITHEYSICVFPTENDNEYEIGFEGYGAISDYQTTSNKDITLGYILDNILLETYYLEDVSHYDFLGIINFVAYSPDGQIIENNFETINITLNDIKEFIVDESQPEEQPEE